RRKPHAVRQHPHSRGPSPGAQGRDRAPRHRDHRRGGEAAQGGGVGGVRGRGGRRLVRRPVAGERAAEEGCIGSQVVSAGVEVRDRRFAGVVGPSVEFERLATDFIFTEGPLWHRREKYLLFSDMPGDHLRRWSAKDGITTFRKPCNKSNGLAWDLQGRLIVCEHATSHLTRTEADGRSTVLASHYDGKELNSPNDVVVKSDGAIYFSDPIYGRKPHYGVPRDPQLSFRGVYRLSPDGKALTLLADDFGQPNGLCFSLDEKVLFVNDTERQHIRAFDVKADGTITNNRIWARTVGEGPGGPDGMKV